MLYEWLVESVSMFHFQLDSLYFIWRCPQLTEASCKTYPVGSLDFSSTHSFQLHYGLGVNLACNSNEYRGYLLGIKVAGA